ncbi:MAG TPA: hypothetical protein VIQ02_16220, partial [Jiangellaceae bacterium]
MAEPKPPDSQYLLEMETELTQRYLKDDEQIDEARAQREMRIPAMYGADQKYSLVDVDPRDPDVSEESFQQTAMLTLERPKLMLEAGESDTAQTNASIREHWTMETLWECGTRSPGSDTMVDVTDAALNDGGGWTKILHNRDLWTRRYSLAAPRDSDTQDAYDEYDRATEDAKKQAGPPFSWIAVDPRQIYPDFSGGTVCEVLEATEVPERTTFRRHRLARDGNGNIVPEDLGQPQAHEGRTILPTSVFMLEHWDERWVTWMVAGRNFGNRQTGRIIKQFEHNYGFIPYDFAPGLWMHFWKNRKVGWGISQTKLWLVRYRQYLRAMHAQYVARDLLSPLVNYGESGAAPVIGNDGKPRDRDPGPLPGEIINLGPGRQLQKIDYSDAATLEKHMGLIDQAIRDLESPRVTTLSGMEGAGFAISQILSYSRTRFGPISHNLEQLLKSQTEKLWSLVENRVGEKVWVGYSGEYASGGYLGLGPDDLKRPVKIKWTVNQALPTDDLIKARYAHERLQAGTWGSDEAIEYLGDNPDEIRRSKHRDRIRQSPQYQQWLDSQVFMFAGRGDILGSAAQAQQIAEQAMPPGMPGAAPMGGLAPGVFEGGAPGA